MERREVEFRSGDGSRRLLAEDTGPLDGPMLIFHAGTPGCRLMPEPWLEEAHRRGLRHVTYSRPGYEGSDRMPGRTAADCAEDVLALVDALGVERFYNVGGSGGGPHALACGALIPDRILATVAISSVGPTFGMGPAWEVGMCRENLDELRALRAGDAALEAHIAREVEKIRAGEDADEGLFGESQCAADRAVMVGEMAEFQAAAGKRAVADGIWGWFDDEKALWDADWCFPLEDVRGPVALWHGAEDRAVPAAHGRWLASQVPDAEFHLLPDLGHVSLFDRAYGAILDTMLAAAVPAA